MKREWREEEGHPERQQRWADVEVREKAKRSR